MGSRLTPRQFVSISLAQLAPSIPAASSNFIVSADADDQAVIRTMDSIDRTGLMISSAPWVDQALKARLRRTPSPAMPRVCHRSAGSSPHNRCACAALTPRAGLAADEDPALAGRGILLGREFPRSP